MIRKLIILFCIILLGCKVSKNASDFQSKEAKKLAKENLVYIYQNRVCPDFINTYKVYGFKIECGSDIYDSLVQKQNKNVIKTIEKHYGKDWFTTNFTQFIAKKP